MKDDILRILWRVPTGLTLGRHLLRSQLTAETARTPGDNALNTALAEMTRDGWIRVAPNRRTGDEELALTDLGREIFTGEPPQPVKPKPPLHLKQ